MPESVSEHERRWEQARAELPSRLLRLPARSPAGLSSFVAAAGVRMCMRACVRLQAWAHSVLRPACSCMGVSHLCCWPVGSMHGPVRVLRACTTTCTKGKRICSHAVMANSPHGASGSHASATTTRAPAGTPAPGRCGARGGCCRHAPPSAHAGGMGEGPPRLHPHTPHACTRGAGGVREGAGPWRRAEGQPP